MTEAGPGGAEGASPGQVLFVTGSLAEPALRRTLEGMGPPFAWEIASLRRVTASSGSLGSWYAADTAA